ncbi:hypothetical protein BV25DRAFT_1818569 [Artomyces pyxidatus]|uniref:Uncharacterized protein n=1 Tax=Artomyces pyxidatus TaxID=48021 RepID=A0ACB8TIA7_9AGAM|nr:hypothetical protein BV25DRAFT_1818569 [Artomyces pyxidatus]
MGFVYIQQMPRHDACIHRARVEVEGTPAIVGLGDSTNKKEAEQWAALSALYQLDGRGMVSLTLRPFVSALISVHTVAGYPQTRTE